MRDPEPEVMIYWSIIPQDFDPKGTFTPLYLNQLRWSDADQCWIAAKADPVVAPAS